MHRTSGLLLHPTSLPSPFGIGDLGPAAYRFIDFLAAAGQGLWQVLPLGPTGYRDSPYQCTSAFAGNPVLISPEWLQHKGWLQEINLIHHDFSSDQVQFGVVNNWKNSCFVQAWLGFKNKASAAEQKVYANFCETEKNWLDEYALYQALKIQYNQQPWTDWPEFYAQHDDKILTHWARTHADQIKFQKFLQYVFFQQWNELRDYAHARGIKIIGDLPLFVAHDSSEVWTHREWFLLDNSGQPTVVAGVPPDYFSKTGQRWGNPLYRWEVLAQNGYYFWVERLRNLLKLVDWVRIDHFRGLVAHWEIPATEATAVLGRWVPGPGKNLFVALQQALGEHLPLIAEDLGEITADVIELRDDLKLPGMAILQFGFEGLQDGVGDSLFLPHYHRANQVVYLGTHDNNTGLGWWHERSATLKNQICAYLNINNHGENIHWDLIRATLASPADFAIFALQDLLGLDSAACMNRPGTAEGNWTWRYQENLLTEEIAERLRTLSRLYGRLPHSIL